MLAVNAFSALQVDEDQGKLILITAASVEQTGFLVGRDYCFVARGGMALCRWGDDDAVIADDGFDFALGLNTPPLIVRATQTALNVIEGESGSSATAVLAVARVAEI